MGSGLFVGGEHPPAGSEVGAGAFRLQEALHWARGRLVMGGSSCRGPLRGRPACRPRGPVWALAAQVPAPVGPAWAGGSRFFL